MRVLITTLAFLITIAIAAKTAADSLLERMRAGSQELSEAMAELETRRIDPEPVLLDYFVKYGLGIWVVIILTVAFTTKNAHRGVVVLYSVAIVAALYLIGAAMTDFVKFRMMDDANKLAEVGGVVCVVYMLGSWLWSRVSQPKS